MANRKKDPAKEAAHDAAWVEIYLQSSPRNAKRAYLQLHPKATERTAEVEGSKLLRKPEIVAIIAERTKALQEKLEITTERVLQEVARVGYFDVRKLYKEDGSLKKPHELDDHTAAAISGIDVEDLFEGRGEDREHIGYLRKYRTSRKTEALRDLMKHLGLFEADREQLGRAIGRAIIVPAKDDNDPDP